jgi:pilus assembly protein Flp/PilA
MLPRATRFSRVFEASTMETVMQKIRQMIRDNKGATAIEYGLIAALIAVAATVAMGGLGNQLKSTFNNVSTKMVVTPTA